MGISERLRKDPSNVYLKQEKKELSLKKTRFLRSSNFTVLNNELNLLDNISTAMNLYPSVIDYAINVGLERTSIEWIKHLEEDGDLNKTIVMNAVIKD